MNLKNLLIGTALLCFGIYTTHFYINVDFWVRFHALKATQDTSYNLPNKNITKIMTFGHNNTYAIFQWLDFVQLSGNSQANIAYQLTKLKHIIDIFPQFEASYQWTLYSLPIHTHNESLHDGQKSLIQEGIHLAYKGIKQQCDTKKLQQIRTIPSGQKLWNDTNLKNPCKSSSLPYMLGFFEGNILGNASAAEYFYKIASMHDDSAPGAKILAILSSGSKNDTNIIAQNFLLTAIQDTSTPDENCQHLAYEIFEKVHNNQLNSQFITYIQGAEKHIQKPKSTLGNYSCFDFLDRGIKYTFLTFINEQSKDFPNIDQIEALLPKIGLKEIPITQTQKNLTIVKKNDTWQYSEK